jgi:hypothetical protein
MTLIDEIVEMSADGSRPVANALRKCLVLAFELKNEKLKVWTEKELNGFNKGDEVPEYRKAILHSKGNFSGPGGARLTNRPLPLAILNSSHWDMLTSKLTQPIAAYEKLATSGLDQNASINWPPDLIHQYQGSYIEGFALSSAWQEVPVSLVVGVCEQVRNRLLRFALEIKDELGHVGDKPSDVPTEKVESAITNYIYGGTNVIGVTVKDFTQIANIVVGKGDFNGLSNALKALEVPEAEIALLKQAIDADTANAKTGLGERTKKWLRNVGSKLGTAGIKVGTSVAQDVVKEWLLQYYGLK